LGLKGKAIKLVETQLIGDAWAGNT